MEDVNKGGSCRMAERGALLHRNELSAPGGEWMMSRLEPEVEETDLQDLMCKIEQIRARMVHLAMENNDLLNERAIRESQRLDKYIVLFQKARYRNGSKQQRVGVLLHQ
ncbi:aspartyl-phosphate phosphatase Spo0E family protein [Paenibacillus thiaminolyticus]|uniref:Aspartyl-phosphate phosphatase Spo0E family protein n=1 Tax=Paenibacillus thiaminolyticus TaxID=49283 RepID=A0AAP9J136_PANTH|nr:aspartyl-phosphate phosphatase Spo0E family protein [Paenibacillus thiaminolyticus]MCY9535972.1 aspartyl-phosphate phosphatase Spo0E family protein [Paenibacillus thiaminolyticus]MCY9602367.1 aspartyl-phosphate phosphatase Spo0E family protein [Paenibacillus thiaminolyticus]MCY9608762.1 aspartyl-phosphate phosphatase Spo0E family protein [Paenibacillus thiaminolyticus]MCY9613509.1 aspartyl-phosphate phosphatase Spo0E family protein [Paenibacillus thiaminolyticus]MCY9620327.1 aspartyl-phosph